MLFLSLASRFLHENERRTFILFCSSERWRGVSFNHRVVGRKRFFSNTTPKSWRPDWLTGPECTPANESIQIFIAKDCGGISPPLVCNCGIQATVMVGPSRYSYRHVCCSRLRRTGLSIRDWVRH